ncbi:MAG TPA: hypothetical protein VKT32_11755 [Chthonomonadaceae bacterium]|nr:hypothetical protein [Chthonomonadaceae bacterium]
METPKRYRLWFVGTALGILIALLLAPATRWLVEAQLNLTLPRQSTLAPLHYLFSRTSSAENRVVALRLQEAAAHHPDDLSIQLAAAVMTPLPESASPGWRVSLTRLRALEAKFPDSPAVRAFALRYAASNAVHIYSGDEDAEQAKALGTLSPASGARPARKGDTPEQLAAFDADAAQGEQLDPDNAYFPLLRAGGLFAAHQNVEALAALRRAAEKPRWEEYIADEEAGRWRLVQEAFGDYGTLPRVAAYAAILFPHYPLIRATARMALYKAVEAEKAGHVEEGLAIRESVLDCGSRMRVQSRIVIGSLVAIAIEAIATTYPGGAQMPKWDLSVTGEQRRIKHIEQYKSWLHRIGHPEERARVQAEMDAGMQAKQICQIAINSKDYAFGPTLGRQAGWWVAGLLTLSNALWMLALGGVAALLACSRRLRAGQPLPRFALWGAGLGLIAGGILTIGLLGPDLVVNSCVALGLLFPGTPWPGLGLAALALGSLAAALSGSRWQERLSGLGLFALGTLTTLVLARLVTWQAEGVGVFLSVIRMFSGMSEDIPAKQLSLAWIPWLAFVVPVLMVAVLTVFSRIYRVPAVAGLVRGLRGVAIPAACILFLVYSGILILTMRQEAFFQEALNRQTRHEGRYMAAIAGREWPGATH